MSLYQGGSDMRKILYIGVKEIVQQQHPYQDRVVVPSFYANVPHQSAWEHCLEVQCFIKRVKGRIEGWEYIRQTDTSIKRIDFVLEPDVQEIVEGVVATRVTLAKPVFTDAAARDKVLQEHLRKRITDYNDLPWYKKVWFALRGDEL